MLMLTHYCLFSDPHQNGNLVTDKNINAGSEKPVPEEVINSKPVQQPTVVVVDMSVETQMSPTDTEAGAKTLNTSNEVSANHNDTNNNKNGEVDSIAPAADHEKEDDSFDTASQPLSRDAMLNKKHKETEETLNFVYKHASSTPLDKDSNLPKIQPLNSGNRYANRRRPSGVPPPPRALISSDPMAKFGKKPLSFAEEDEES